MERAKQFVADNLERITVLLILIGIAIIHFFVLDKLPFLSFYYIPVLLAAWGCGRRTALLMSVLAVFLVVLYAVALPSNFDEKLADLSKEFNTQSAAGAPQTRLSAIEKEIADRKFDIHFSLASWGAFLILAAVLVGTLYDQKEKRAKELRHAYVGILELLTKCLECTDRHVLGHSQRVAELAVEVARELKLPENAVEKVRVGGLLHDIGKVDVSVRALQKSTGLSEEERKEIGAHALRGAEILRSVEVVLHDVIPIVRYHHERILNPDTETAALPDMKVGPELKLCIGIISVADAFDAIVSDRPYRPGKLPWQAVQEIEANAGTQFDPEVAGALKNVISRKI